MHNRSPIHHGSTIVSLASLMLLGLAACQGGEQEGDATSGETAAGHTAGGGPAVEIVARDYAFEGIPDTLSAGWTTFRLENAGREVHFVLFDRVPEGRGMQDFAEEIAPPFDSVWYQLRDGEIDQARAAQMLGEQLPAWFAEVVRWGGTGLIAPGSTAQTTLELEPGTYVAECYVKTPDGEFHVSLGMASEFVVTGDSARGSPPEADLEVTLANDGIVAPDMVAAGEYTVAVRFREHPEAGLGNDVHVVRLDEGTTLDDVTPWMFWMNVEGMGAPAPAEFLGGSQEMPAGRTAYFTVELTPGTYAWISEAPDARGMAREFVVR